MALVLSNSKSNTFKRCQKQFEFKYVNKLRRKSVGLPLFRGDWLHQLLMVHYDQGDWKERHRILKEQNWDSLFPEEREEIGEGRDLPLDIERMMKSYLAHWRTEDKQFVVVDTELNEFVELPNGMMLNVIIDMIVEQKGTGHLWFWDHKSVSNFYPEDFLLIDSQLALYFWTLSKLGYPVIGALLNELITKPPTLPKWLEKSQRFEMRKNIHCDAYTYYACIKAAGQDPQDYKSFLAFLRTKHDDWWRRTPLPRDKAMVQRVMHEMMATGYDIEAVTERGFFTRTSRKECRYDCDFLELCQAQLQGISTKETIRSKYEKSQRPPEEEQLKRMWPAHSRRNGG